MAKYGIENFNYEVIACAKTQGYADEIEAQIIQQYNSRDKLFGYNLKPGGGTTGHSEETKQKIRKAILQRIEIKGPPALGSKRTPEQRAKMSAIQQSRNLEYTPEIRKHMSDAHIGKSQSKELVEKRAAIIRANKGDMICGVPGCGEIHDRRHAPIIDGIRYCAKHAWRFKATGTLELLPRQAHNKKQFTNDDINKILSDNRSAKTIGKDFGVSERVILRIRKEYKNNH